MNINEHLWSGIIHRSETGEVRKEDDVNLFDLLQLVEYLENKYNKKGDILYNEREKKIYLFLGDINLEYTLNDTCTIEFSSKFVNCYRLDQYFSQEILTKYNFRVRDRGREYDIKGLTNKDVIEIIDDYYKIKTKKGED
jgi:hypothetical protein